MTTCAGSIPPTEDLDEIVELDGGDGLRKRKTTRITGSDFPMKWFVQVFEAG